MLGFTRFMPEVFVAALIVLLLIEFNVLRTGLMGKWGWRILTLGVGVQLLVIASNGWRIPADCSGIPAIDRKNIPGQYFCLNENTRLRFLADFIHIPGIGIASVSDLLITVGVVLSIVQTIAVILTSIFRKSAQSPQSEEP